MKYSLIPGTDLSVSKVCLGTMTFGSPVSEEKAKKMSAALRYWALWGV